MTAGLLTNIALRARCGFEPNPKIDVHFAFLTYIVVTCVASLLLILHSELQFANSFLYNFHDHLVFYKYFFFIFIYSFSFK